jgi:V/A-type H+-transporting ATPase subunit C
MLSTYASNSILAKTRAKYGRCLNDQNYRDLAGLGSVTDVAAYLKTRTHYSAVLENMRESAVHRGNLERLLEAWFLIEVNRLCRFERSVGEHMFECVIRRTELGELLAFLRYLTAGHPKDYLLHLSETVNYHSGFDLAALCEVTDYDGLLEFLQGTDLYKVFLGFRPQKGQKLDFTMLETSLDKYLYGFEIGVVKKNFTGETQEELCEILTVCAEMLNLRRIIRAKQYFSAGGETLRSMMIDAHSGISQRRLEEMIEAPTTDAAVKVLKRTGYRRDLERISFSYIDDFAKRVIYSRCRSKIRMSIHPAVVMLCYIKLMEIEIDNVTNIIEGVRYQLGADEISKLLVTGQ